MNIILLKECMKGEGRVPLMPEHCMELVQLGHRVFVEPGAGEKSGYADHDYCFRGARSLPISEIISLFEVPHTVVLKVKQPLPEDNVWFSRMNGGVLFAYFHSIGEKNCDTISTLLLGRITAVSYENIEASDGTRPLLVPMSKIAGRLAVEWGVNLSRKAREISGFLGMDNQHFQMTIFGAGTAGCVAIKKGLDLGFSRISVFEKEAARKRFLCERLTSAEMKRVKIFLSDDSDYEKAKTCEIRNTDLLVGTVLVSNGPAPIVVSKEEVESMNKGSVIVDVACDQGGCVWYPENESGTVFEYEGKVFCRTPNMPGSVPKESTPVLANAIFPYLLAFLDGYGYVSFKKNIGFRKGLITYDGLTVNREVAHHWREPYTDPDTIFNPKPIFHPGYPFLR